MPSLLSTRRTTKRTLSSQADPSARGAITVSDPVVLDRIRFLGVTEDDLSQIARWRRVTEGTLDALVDRFYAKILGHPVTRPVLERFSSVERQRPLLSAFVRSLMSGALDDRYVGYRIRVGEAHDRIRLDMAWYIAMYEVLRAHLEEAVEAAGATSDEMNRFRIALARVIQLDIALTVEALAQSRQRRIDALQHEQEAI
ncbi:MAG: hypothetical protein FIA95_04505, partial [Gemmatimonadetes bacterium]|nr:hypothetical protein [Gemmatimonadota bacterium]